MLLQYLNIEVTFLLLQQTIIIYLMVLLSTCFVTLLERKILGIIQNRTAPNYISYIGILQPIVDGVKLIIKELVVPNISNKNPFIISSLLSLILTVINWTIIPFHDSFILLDVRLGFIYLLALTSLSIYCIIISG
jgi:NADH-quinone oxidoreductase subunit H